MRERLIKEIKSFLEIKEYRFIFSKGLPASQNICTSELVSHILSTFDVVEKGSVEKLTAERDRLREALSWICSESGDERVFNRAVEALSPEPEKVDKGK